MHEQSGYARVVRVEGFDAAVHFREARQPAGDPPAMAAQYIEVAGQFEWNLETDLADALG
jgi:hypothetical protein